MTSQLTSPRTSHGVRLSFDEIAAFVQLVETGTFTGAAEREHISQPGFSARIARLERGLGHRLIDRSQRRLHLTPAGEQFLPTARVLLGTLTAALQRL